MDEGRKIDLQASKDEVRQRKDINANSVKSEEDWEEPVVSDDIQLQRKIDEYKQDPLCLLAAFPTPRQRKAQKTIQNSIFL